MTDEVKAAVARLRGDASNLFYWKSESSKRDAMIVAAAALPLFDETPVTKDWCESVGFETRAIYMGTDWVPTVWGNDDWIEFSYPTTRGQLRLLALALGITLKEQP